VSTTNKTRVPNRDALASTPPPKNNVIIINLTSPTQTRTDGAESLSGSVLNQLEIKQSHK
jgi:hypothetical protein